MKKENRVKVKIWMGLFAIIVVNITALVARPFRASSAENLLLTNLLALSLWWLVWLAIRRKNALKYYRFKLSLIGVLALLIVITNIFMLQIEKSFLKGEMKGEIKVTKFESPKPVAYEIIMLTLSTHMSIRSLDFLENLYLEDEEGKRVLVKPVITFFTDRDSAMVSVLISLGEWDKLVFPHLLWDAERELPKSIRKK